MINIFQFLLNNLNTRTLIRLEHITNNPYFKIAAKQRLGFTTISLKNFLSKTDNLINYRKKLYIYKNENNLHLYSGDEAVHFKITIIDNNILLTTYFTELQNIIKFKQMMILFKKIFNEFYTQKCTICHSADIIVRLKISYNVHIEIPAYIHCTLIQKNKQITIT